MSISFTTSNKWMARQLPGVEFFLNDAVKINSGREAGQTAAVISLVETEPEPIYLVETQHGNDIRIAQSKLSKHGVQ